MTPQEQYEFCRMVLRFKDRTILPEELRLLDMRLSRDPEAIELYDRICELYCGLYQSQGFASRDEGEAWLSEDFWRCLAQDEMTSPSAAGLVETAASSNEVVVPHAVYQRPVRHISKLSLYTLIVSSSIFLFLMVFIRFAPVRHDREVATLDDSINAQWFGHEKTMKVGSRLTVKASALRLSEGVARIAFDNGSTVIIEGPAEFQIDAEDRVRVHYGRLYAIVPRSAIGFSVITPNSTIIDLGTEFGVLAGLEGGTELHVIKGETALLTGQHNGKASVLVKEGAAKRIVGESATVSDITPNDRLFVRKIDSDANLIWRGEAINLADVVGGGSGFGGGTLNSGYSPLKGELEVFSVIARASAGPETYRPIQSNPLIDGIFVPNGSRGPVQVSTQGHVFENCPATTGQFWQGIFNGAWHGAISTKIPKHQLRLDGKTYGTGQYAAIYMHANQGITFDLDAFRKTVGSLNLVRFVARAGISETVQDYPQLSVRDAEGRITLPMASFFVLVDGAVRFEKIDATPTEAATAIEVALTAQDRFLTLITTQGGDIMGINEDWTLFAEPVLQIEWK
jgi:hypothetical protein